MRVCKIIFFLFYKSWELDNYISRDFLKIHIRTFWEDWVPFNLICTVVQFYFSYWKIWLMKLMKLMKPVACFDKIKTCKNLKCFKSWNWYVCSFFLQYTRYFILIFQCFGSALKIFDKIATMRRIWCNESRCNPEIR